MARYKVPSKAASGKDTFSDSLVGLQITDGSSQLTNTNFAIDRDIPEKDSKNFRTASFSEFLTLDSLKNETNLVVSGTTTGKKEIKFKNAKNDTARSLYGSLSHRLLVSITNIIKKFPASFLIDSDGFIGTTTNTADNIQYSSIYNTTSFVFQHSRIFNPFDIVLIKPNSNTLPESENPIRNFYSSYKKYILELNGEQYEIVDFTQHTSQNKFKLTVKGNPFLGVSAYTENILIKPNNGIVEEFFQGLDEIETQLLNRETNPIYNASFIVPRDSFDKTSTDLVTVKHNWPLSKDGWNISISGIDYETYVTDIRSIGDEVDTYKSNLIVRFLSSPQLFEFDSIDKKGEAIFQLYGQSFDKVKKYIDNIAYMRNVSYDGINNLPDILLKNLSETLGLSTLNLFDEKRFEEILYTRKASTYSGESVGKNIIEAEYEFYRRLLVNLAFIFKSKGTRSALHFFLRFLGAPEPLIRIDEYVYKVIDIPNSKNLEDEIMDVIVGGKTTITAKYNTTTNLYEKVFTTGYTTYTREGYPVYEDTTYPRKPYNPNEDIFFQKGSGWFDVTLDHRGPDILDIENSILTGRTKVIKTKMKPYTYGEDYFDVFRTLPGLDIGFELESDIDNKKIEIVNEQSPYLLNRKNISVYLAPSRAIDYDIWRKSKDLLLTFGSNTLYPQTGITFAEFINKTIHSQIKNSNVIRYRKNYIVLEDVYNSYVSSSGFTPYNFIDSHEFIKKMSPYWTQVIGQIVPATTLWTGGNLIDNSIFGRSKFQYKFDCQPIEIEENLYPNFAQIINEDIETILGDPNNFRGLINLTGVTYLPIIEIDGQIFSDTQYSVLLSGTTSTTGTAKLFDVFPMTGCTVLSTGSTESLPLICDFKDYLDPDYSKVEELWFKAVTGLVENVVNVQNDKKLLSYEIFVENGITKIRFTSIKHSQSDCSINNYFLFKYDTIYGPSVAQCTDQIDFCSQSDVYSGGTENCLLNSDITFTVQNAVGLQKYGLGWPVFIYSNCTNDLNENVVLSSGRTIEYLGNCEFRISGVTENDNIEFNIIDASNCETRVKINGLQLKAEHDPYSPQKSHYQEFIVTVTDTNTTTIENELTSSAWCDNFTGYTIIPDVEIRKSINYGLKDDSYVYVVTGVTAYSQLTGGTFNNISLSTFVTNGEIIKKQVQDVVVGDKLLIGINKPASALTRTQFQKIPLSGCSFSYTYSVDEVSSIQCLGSLKTTTITGVTITSGTTIINVLPTTKLRVYTNKKVTNGIVTNKSYYFDSRYPEDLQIKGTESGDFMINSDGYPIEVTGIDLNYCNLNRYYNFNFVTNELNSLFNGQVNNLVYLNHEFVPHNFGLSDIKVVQYYTDPENCDISPSINELERPEYGTSCNNEPL